MSIEQNIVDAVEISKYTKIPVLFMSNPGLGKTTILKRYAARYGYHLETLIGSRFTPEEISGYQVNNGGDHLQHMNPEWFNRILQREKEGKRTLLFVDELSTCSEFVQGALLSLIFDRTIGNEKYLPKDCFIIAAANYAKNLPSSMNMMAPTLNRFIIVNLNDNYNALDMMKEFLNPPTPAHYPSSIKKLTPQVVQDFSQGFQKAWREIFIKYSDPKSTLGYLDIENHNLDGLYTESEHSVYNFISGRSISYLLKVLLCYYALEIQNIDILGKLIDGLVGAGTCLFKEENQARVYRELVHSYLFSLIPKNSLVKKGAFLNFENQISKDVPAFIQNFENINFSEHDGYLQLMELLKEIEAFFSPNKFVITCQKTEGISEFISNYEAIIELRKKLSNHCTFSNFAQRIFEVELRFYGYYKKMANINFSYGRHFGKQYSKITNVFFIKETPNSKELKTIALVENLNMRSDLLEIKNDDYLYSMDFAKFKKVYKRDIDKIVVYNYKTVKYTTAQTFSFTA